MLRSFDRRGEVLLRGLSLALSGLFIFVFLAVAWRRLHYPFEVDRMESGMLTSVWRLRHGYPLYGPPSLQWAPFLYAPLFFYVSAAVSKVVGIQYIATRLVSIVSTLGAFGLIFALVFTETKRRAPALFAVGVFASLYPFVLAWYDVGRVDSLALFFFLAALLATRRDHMITAAVLWWLAFLTKQTFLPIGLAVFLIDWQRPKRMLLGVASFVVLVVASLVWLQRLTHGWFKYYAFGTTGVIKWSTRTAVMFPFADLLNPLPVACGLIILAAYVASPRWREREGSYLAIVSVIIAGAILYVRAHVGANLNAVIPLYAWVSVLAGVALHRLLTASETSSIPGASTLFPAALWLLASVQLAMHLYRPAEIPSGNLAARMAFLEALRKTPGDVWVVDHSFDGILAGKPLHADMDALDAVLGRGYRPAVKEFRQIVGEGKLNAVVLDRTPDAYEPEGLFTAAPFSRVYRLRAVVPGGGAQGDLDQPMYSLVPCSSPETAAGSLTDTRGRLVDRGGCAN